MRGEIRVPALTATMPARGKMSSAVRDGHDPQHDHYISTHPLYTHEVAGARI